jgi:hypothetical protein
LGAPRVEREHSLMVRTGWSRYWHRGGCHVGRSVRLRVRRLVRRRSRWTVLGDRNWRRVHRSGGGAHHGRRWCGIIGGKRRRGWRWIITRRRRRR